MGYKGKNDREKVRIELTAKFIVLPTEDLKKQIVGENRCNDISFRPRSGELSKKDVEGYYN